MLMKTMTCRTCQIEKPQEDFHWKKEGRWRRTECIPCHSQRNRRNYVNRRDGLSAPALPEVSPLIRCSRCREVKPREGFTRNAARPNGLNNQCTACRKDGYERSAGRILAERRRRYKADPEHRAQLRAEQRRAATGVLAPEYDAMCAEQGNCCYICGKACTSGKALAMDHDHATGKLRRPLCSRCNLTLGKVHDDTALLRRMADYLDRFSA